MEITYGNVVQVKGEKHDKIISIMSLRATNGSVAIARSSNRTDNAITTSDIRPPRNDK